MSLVTEQPIPNIQPSDWIFVFSGLGVGVGSVFLIIAASASKSQQKRVFTLTNFWLILSGVIHVNILSLFSIIMINNAFYSFGLSSIWCSIELVRI